MRSAHACIRAGYGDSKGAAQGAFIVGCAIYADAIDNDVGYRLYTGERACLDLALSMANERIRILRGSLDGRTHTMSAAMEAYEHHMRFEKQNKYASVKTTLYRLRSLLADALDTHVATITERRAQELYSARAAGGVSAATHRSELREVRTFWKWMLWKRWVVSNPWTEVMPVGRVNRGKEQLRAHEARRFDAIALRQANGLDLGDDH